MTTESAISRSVLSDQVKDRLLQAILEGRYPPGARIVETRVAREFGTSQGPVRDALRDLETLGVVQTAPFRGARVRHLTADELLDAFAVRAQLEVLAARRAIQRITDDELDELSFYLDDMRRSAPAGDPRADAGADASFHGRIVQIAANATLERLWLLLEPFSRAYITMMAPGLDRRRLADLHQAIIDGLRQGDPELTTAALERHYRETGAMVAEVWAPPSALAGVARPADAIPSTPPPSAASGRPVTGLPV